jgi:ribose transport system permease protein
VTATSHARTPTPPRARKVSGTTWRQQHGWTLGVWLLLAALIAWYVSLIPAFGSFQIASIAKNSLPLVFLAVGQAVIVLSGGIDLSIGNLMVLSSCVAARVMLDRPFSSVLLLAVVILVGAAVAHAIVGWFVHRSRVPDIVVTLAMGFVYAGITLLVLPSPGGGTAPRFRWLFTGAESGIGGNYWPPLVMMLVPTLLVVALLRRTRTGLTLYATGSDRNAAYLAGVDVGRAKVISYAVGGMMASFAGLATIAITNTGDPRYMIGANATLNSVAAIVLGGIALTGGVGSVVGVVAAAIVLVFLNPILSSQGVDPNTAQIIQGALIAVVMMVAGLVELRRRRLA